MQALGKNFDKNYDWSVNVENARGNFEVTQATVTITVSDHDSSHPQSSEFGQTPTINPDDYTLTIKTDAGQTLTYKPVTGDLDFKNGTPSDAGKYKVVLSAQGLANIKRTFGTKNYTYKSTGNGNYWITAAKAIVTLSGNGQKTYDASQASLNSEDYTLNIQADNGAVLTYTLHNNDLTFVDAHGNPMTAPTSAGTYQVRLTTAAQNAIEALGGNNGKNYDWTLTQTASYKINQAAGTATLSGDVHKDYDGKPISNLSGITVTVNYPGAGINTTYTLKDGDYEFVKNGIHYATAPSDAGTYKIVLTKSGKANIAKLGGDNIDWSGKNAFTENASYTINPVAIDVVMNGSQTKPYDGKSFDPNKFVPTISAGQLKLPNISAGTFTADDFTLVDSQNKVVTNPVNVGTYKVELNSNGLKKLQDLIGKDNFTWPTAINTTGTFIIQTASATATLGGSNSKTENGQATTTAELNNDGTITVSITTNSGLTTSFKLQDGDYTWNTGSAPSKVGSYTITLSAAAKNRLQAQLDQKYGKGNVVLNQVGGQASFEIKTKPAQPTIPTEPTEPTKPTQPTNNNVPTQPATPNGPETQPTKSTVPIKPVLPNIPPITPIIKPDKPLKPAKPSNNESKPGKPNRKPVILNKDDRTHSNLSKQAYSINNGPKNEGKLTGPSKAADAIRNKRANGPVKAAEAELGKRSMSMGKAEARHLLAGKLNAKPKSAEESLPQTGSKQKPALSIIGALLAGLSWIGLLGIGKRKKKDE